MRALLRDAETDLSSAEDGRRPPTDRDYQLDLADAVSDIAASDDLAVELRASQAALALIEERLAFAVEASGALGWWDWDITRDRVYAGEVFARMYGVDPAEAAAGAPLSAFVDGIHPDDRDVVAAKITATAAEAGEFREEYRLLGADGSVTWVYARGRCYHDAAGRPSRFPGVVIDITDRKCAERRKDALIELGDRIRDRDDVGEITSAAAEVMARALGATRAGYGLVDHADESIVIQPDWRLPGAASIAGLHRFRDYGNFVDDLKRGETVIITDVETDPRTRAMSETLLALGIRVLVNVPIVERGRLAAVAFVHYDAPHLWTEEEVGFVRTMADRTQAAVARARAEEQQRWLNGELSHRLKNTLAMVQSIATQTLRNATDLDAAREDLVPRLIALGKAHDILLAGSRESAEVSDVVAGALALHAGREGRFTVEGPMIRLDPSLALSLSMILHELATNAAKYGSLSQENGRVSVSWSIVGTTETTFRLAWVERDGPPVSTPSRKGFGSRLIERGLAGGSVTTDYAPEGLTCTLEAILGP
ncbi:PAS domain-containing protein [Methylobacterium sp. C25]|uniref:sensor histidine kinase n=1 Tax=Methylobacterium sp. C25 TaxID=2721622 RepID=UPI001F2E84CC|nr:HWE histidine kinase domain-containing protein [Methylobacterium sp. C25]MCE4225687.1 PAS domain-containing protein [Methylobacterium sp. C25]